MDTLRVSIGEYDLEKEDDPLVKIMNIAASRIHENYEDSMPHPHDIAIIKTSDKVEHGSYSSYYSSSKGNDG